MRAGVGLYAPGRDGRSVEEPVLEARGQAAPGVEAPVAHGRRIDEPDLAAGSAASQVPGEAFECAVPAVELRNISVRYGPSQVLDVTSLAVARGETLTVMGPNGSGKSTLLRIVALLERPTEGVVLHDGRQAGAGTDALDRRRQLALVMQQPVFRNASTWENVATGLRFRRLRRHEMSRRVDRWLDRLDIAGLARQNARLLSGGEAQRANLARALVLEPGLLLLDEPFGALDAPTKLRLMDDLAEILRSTPTTTLFVTHDRAEAQVFGDRLAVLIGGRLRQVGRPGEIFSMPAGEDIAGVVGVDNVLSGAVIRSAKGLSLVSIAGRDLAVVGDYRPGDHVVLGIRPEVIVLARMPQNGLATSARNGVTGDIVRITPMGAQARVVVDCGFPLVSLITQGSLVEMALVPGMRVRATFKASAVHTIRHIKCST